MQNKASPMRLRKLLDDDDAVSPVIGVILMVAITVILAAVIASFVLGLGPSGSQQPTASFGFDYNGGSGVSDLVISHENGDQIKENNLYIRGNFGSGSSTSSAGTWASLGGSASASIGSTSAVSSGDSVTVQAGSDYDLSVVWEVDDNSATLTSDTGPDA